MTSLKNAKLETEIDAVKVRFLEKQEKVIALENYSRRENLLLMNVPEQTEQEGENCANNIYDIIENELNIDVENLEFHAIRRVGKRRSSDETSKAYPRPVIACFLCRGDRDMVLKAKGRLRNSSRYTNAYTEEDAREVFVGFLKTELGMENADQIEFQKVHRVGKRVSSNGKP